MPDVSETPKPTDPKPHALKSVEPSNSIPKDAKKEFQQSMQLTALETERVNVGIQRDTSRSDAQFRNQREVKKYYDNNISGFANYGGKDITQAMRSHLSGLKINTNDLNQVQVVDKFFETIPYRRVGTVLNHVAKQSGIRESNSKGSFVHRGKQLASLKEFPPDDFVGDKPRRGAEKIFYANDKRGKPLQLRIDNFASDKEKISITDTKPMNLQRFIDANPSGKGEQFHKEMTDLYGSNYKDRIEKGEILPFADQRISPDVRSALNGFIKLRTERYKKQLSRYSSVVGDFYKKEVGDLIIDPYFTFDNSSRSSAPSKKK
ncbi:MAG TPA: hypothetical protein PLV64_02600 [Anaerolineales bacterium]|nr:hypothetical protein [Anaerolineales bacterium]